MPFLNDTGASSSGVTTKTRVNAELLAEARVLSNAMHGRFQPGTHLQVQRMRLYYHHGIYISDDRVIQFGGIENKRGAGICAVSLADFERGGTAMIVRHGYDSWLTGWHPPADAPWRIVARAEFLLSIQPRLPYNVIGHNCEIIANMCASGGWMESYQVRRAFSVRAVMDAVLLLSFSGRRRTRQPLPGWLLPMVVMGTLVNVSAKFTYDSHIRRFWNEICNDWKDHERTLARDPRNDKAVREPKGPLDRGYRIRPPGPGSTRSLGRSPSS
jgi:hypothetical protein